jgi:hypothetical protein
MSTVRCQSGSSNSNNNDNEKNSPAANRVLWRMNRNHGGVEKENGPVPRSLLRRRPRCCQWKPQEQGQACTGRRPNQNSCVRLVSTAVLIFGLVSLLVDPTEGFVVGRQRSVRRRPRPLDPARSDLPSTPTPDDVTPGAVPTSNTNNNKYNKYNNHKIMDLATFQEHELKEMDWLVRSTATLLDRDNNVDDLWKEQDDTNNNNNNNRSPQLPVAQTKSEIRRVHLLMKAWARQSPVANSHAPRVVERILQRLVEERDAGTRSNDEHDNNNDNDNMNNNSNNIHIKDDDSLGVITTKTYNILLDAWSQSREEGSAERAEQILSEMETLYLVSGDEDLRPNESSYNACIKAHVKNGSSNNNNRNSNGADSVNKAQAILDRMAAANVTPNRRSYNLLLYALANSSFVDAAKRADSILCKMLAAYRQGDENVKPDINSYNQVIASWARGKVSGFEYRMQSVLDKLLRDSVSMKIQPNGDTFNAVMGGWLKSNKPEAQERIEDVLQKMQTSFANGNEDAKPDRVSINTVIVAFCKNGGDSSTAVERAMEMRDSMESEYSIKPDTVTNNILVDSWCKSRRPDAPERVVEMLDVMERDYKKGQGRVKPDSYTYSSVIDSYTKCSRVDAGERAEEILERMRDLYRNHGGDAAVTSVYNAGKSVCLFAWVCRRLHVNDAPYIRFRQVPKLTKLCLLLFLFSH